MPSVLEDAVATAKVSKTCRSAVPVSPLLPSCPDALLAAAHKADQERRARAAREFTAYRLDAATGTLIKLDGTATYTPRRFATRAACPVPFFSGCSCPDCSKTITPLLDALDTLNIGTAVACKHTYIRTLLYGGSVRVGGFVVRAKAQALAA